MFCHSLFARNDSFSRVSLPHSLVVLRWVVVLNVAPTGTHLPIPLGCLIVQHMKWQRPHCGLPRYTRRKARTTTNGLLQWLQPLTLYTTADVDAVAIDAGTAAVAATINKFGNHHAQVATDGVVCTHGATTTRMRRRHILRHKFAGRARHANMSRTMRAATCNTTKWVTRSSV